MYAAVIVETRKVQNFGLIVANHMKFLPDWKLVVYTSPESEDYVFEQLTEQNLPIYGFNGVEVNNVQDYNALLLSPDFWKPLCEFERVLIFQSDSEILRKGIEEFLEWDYVGAPWKFQEYGGNGGLSLRNPQIMWQLTGTMRETSDNEDVAICNASNRYRVGIIAPREVCEKFSCETIFKLGTWGAHAIDSHLTDEECKLIRLSAQFGNTIPNNFPKLFTEHGKRIDFPVEYRGFAQEVKQEKKTRQRKKKA